MEPGGATSIGHRRATQGMRRNCRVEDSGALQVWFVVVPLDGCFDVLPRAEAAGGCCYCCAYLLFVQVLFSDLI
jgi:hypothetical protein